MSGSPSEPSVAYFNGSSLQDDLASALPAREASLPREVFAEQSPAASAENEEWLDRVSMAYLGKPFKDVMADVEAFYEMESSIAKLLRTRNAR